MQSKRRIRWMWIESGIGAVLLIFALIFANHQWNWTWTGFNKTLWDWMQLLIIPIVLAVGAFIFNLAQTRTEQKIAAQRYQNDQDIATNKQREDLLQTYLDRMAELLLDKNLRSSQPDAEVRNVARARTLTILTQLDAQRKGSLIQFLSESKLVEIISLRSADLSGANLVSADLRAANLVFADLSNVHLNGAKLGGADLSYADLGGAHLYNADLGGAKLNGADLSGADLSSAHLNSADLGAAKLGGANLNDANLSYADLRAAKLVGTNLSGADLSGAKLGSSYTFNEKIEAAKRGKPDKTS